MWAYPVVEEVPVKIQMLPADAIEVNANIGPLPLDPSVRLPIEQRRFDIEMVAHFKSVSSLSLRASARITWS
jgi:hypothetical protein